MFYLRLPNLARILARKSAFPFGPRSSGKTYLYTQTLNELADLLAQQIPRT